MLQIRRPQYWRIELPVAEPDDTYRAVLLREVFDKILLFEKTECPFQRSFTVELPSPPETPVKRKAWTADGKNLISTPFQDLSPPAHAPMAISRGERSTSMSYEFSLVDDAHDRCPVGVRDRSLSQVASSNSAHEDSGAPTNVGRVRDRAPWFWGQDDDHHSVGPLERSPINPPTWRGKIFQSSTATSIPSSPSTSTEGFQYPDISSPDSSVGEMEALHEQTRSYRYRESHGFQGSEDNVHVDIPRIVGELEAASHRARETREPRGVNNKRVRPSMATGARAQQDCVVADEGDDDARKPGNPKGVDDLASFEGSGHVAPVNLARKRMTRMLAGRSYTSATPPPTMAAPSNEKSVGRKVAQSKPPHSQTESRSPGTSTDSFHSVQSWRSSVTPTREFSSEVKGNGVLGPSAKATQSDDVSAPKDPLDTSPDPPATSDGRHVTQITAEKDPKEPAGGENAPGARRPSMFEDKLQVRRRSHANSLSISHRALSPLPPAANFFAPPPRPAPQSRLSVVRGLPATIIQKTIELLLGPPSYLVKLMLKVAAKIAAGQWRGLVLGFGEAGEQIPVQWDYYSDGEFSDLSDSDDYTLAARSSNYNDGVSRTNVRRRARHTRDDDDDDHSCEVD